MFSLCKLKIVIYLFFVVFQFSLVSVNANQLNDPTRPPGVLFKQNKLYKNIQQYPWRLSSTLISSERQIATINGKLVRPGEKINGATLIAIDAWTVTLIKNNKEFKVYLFDRLNFKK